ncbi:MAG: DUF1566 domain-containing protein [Spirochaetaceae bacterium]|nr:DUF1566 domain-containing protein [Spirochaetaceae bacterium]
MKKFNCGLIVLVIVCFCVLVVCCGGGAGGGAGGISVSSDGYTTHNAGGWGGGSSGGSNNGSGGNSEGGGTGVNTTGGTPLVVDHYVDSETGTFAGSQINDLIAAIQNKNTRSNSVFYVPFYVVGDSVPRQARVTKANKKVEKFEHQYKAACVVNGTTTNVFYYIDDGINLSSMNVANLVGWRCSANNQLYGSTISGVSGDITLTAEFLGMNATPDKTVLYGGSSVASDKTATITITDADGTVSVDSTSSSLLSTAPAVQDASDPSTYTMEITLNDTSMFADDTPANLVLTDGSSTRTVTFTLKNKYTVEVQYGANAGVMGTFLQGSPVTFATAATAASTMIPAGREAVAFKYGSNIVLYKNASAGATAVNVSSTTFTGLTSRQIILDSVLDFTWSYTSGGDTSVTGQNGTSANPYILKYNGTAAQQVLNFAIADKTGNVDITTNAGSWLSIGGTQTNPTIELYAPAVVEANIPAGGKPFTVTLTDSGTGATKDIYVKVTKAPVIPNFTVTVTAPTSHVAAKSSGTTYALANVTDTFSFTPYSAEGFPDGTTFTWTLVTTNSAGDELDNISQTTSLSTNDGVLTISPSALGLTETVVSHSGSSPDGITVSCTANNSAASTPTKVCTTPGTASAFLLYTLPAFTISAAPTSYDVANSPTSGGVTTYALTSASTSIDLTATSSGAAFPAGTTFDWTVDGYSLTGGASQHEATVNGVGLSGLGITLSSSSATPTSIVITCTAKNANATADLDATDFTLKLFLLTIPNITVTLSTPPTGLTTDDNGAYLITAADLTTKNFEFTASPASGTMPSGVKYAWTIGTTDLNTPSTTDQTITKTLDDLGVTAVPTTEQTLTIKCTVSHDSLAAGTEKYNTVDVKIIKRPPLGSKAAPDAVGDIVFSDGSAEPYSASLTLTDEQKDAAIAVIFDATNKLGVGLVQGSVRWAASGTIGYTTNIVDLQATLDSGSSANDYVFNGAGASDGSGSLAKFRAAVGASDGTNLSSTDYPAWAWIEGYATTAGLTGAYASGWYMPSIKELCDLYKFKDTVNNSISKTSATQMVTSYYWSSSQYASYDNYACLLTFDSGYCIYSYKNDIFSVCAVRAF